MFAGTHMNKDGALLAVALLIGIQIPSTIEKIPNATVKSLVQIVAVLVLVLLGLRINPKAIGSLRPPPPDQTSPPPPPESPH